VSCEPVKYYVLPGKPGGRCLREKGSIMKIPETGKKKKKAKFPGELTAI
jgi:hypothetical protein